MNDGGPFHFREVTPKDFYFAQILRNEDKSLAPLLMRLSMNPENLEGVKIHIFRRLVDWAVDNLLKESLFSVENWLEVSFHLNKQRWDDGIDWLERQPMSKIRYMLEVNKKHAEQQNKDIGRKPGKR